MKTFEDLLEDYRQAILRTSAYRATLKIPKLVPEAKAAVIEGFEKAKNEEMRIREEVLKREGRVCYHCKRPLNNCNRCRG